MRKGILALLAVLFVLCAGTAFAADKTYTLRLATVVSPPHPWHEAANYLQQELEKRTNGAVKVRIFGGSQLGSDQSTFEEMRMGTIDLIIGGATTLINFVPELGALNLPYFYSGIDQFKFVMEPQGPVVKRFKEIYASKNLGARLLALGGGGTRVFSNNLRDVVGPEGLKGMKMRVPNSPKDAKIWSTAGALVVAMPWGEIYSALQTGVVNAFESTLSGYFGSKLYEVAKHMSNTQHIIMVSHLLMSEATAKKLPPEYVKIIEELSDEVGRIFTDKGEEFDKQVMADLKEKYGVVISEVDMKAFMDIFQPLHDELMAADNNEELLKLLRESRDAAPK